MSREEPPRGTIIGSLGPTSVGPDARFSPTSAIGDGALHVDGKLAGFVYAAVKYRDTTAAHPRADWTFSALDRDHRELMAFNEQKKALEFLIDAARAENR